MANKYYTRDSSKWVKQSRFRPGQELSTDPAKIITYFAFDPDLDPSGTVAKAKAAYVAAFEVVDGLRGKRGELEASKKFTPLGLQEQLGDAALKEALPALKRSRVAIEKLQSEIKEKRSKITLAKPSDDQRKDHEEIRSAMRAMTPAQRDQFLSENRGNPVVASAIANAIPALSGVHPDVHRNIATEQLLRERGPEIEELDSLSEVLNLAADVSGKARNELRHIIGCSPQVFDEIAKVAEANDGRAPMRRELRVVGGEQVEIPRVYDIDRKVWRDASAEEIKGFAA
ncbi:hypothetical protein [Pseudorhodoplanes sp.]|uniref:hypothetical protein n=1 Tax=Pseudorhodoplanes sp. TaxID=1934341 RepID=UPI002D189AC0|nr:hypothetical protein [Pseudorhodoplanes sp.]HWV41315.1 hypothetical protein [Pseudorhodoplanes sp.]